MNLEVNPEKLRNAATMVESTGIDYETHINNLYSKIGEMNSYWTGAEYDQFKSIMEGYRDDLNKLTTLLKTSIPQDLNLAATNYEKMQAEMQNIASNL